VITERNINEESEESKRIFEFEAQTPAAASGDKLRMTNNHLTEEEYHDDRNSPSGIQ
jgi:hypothetical protein